MEGVEFGGKPCPAPKPCDPDDYLYGPSGFTISESALKRMQETSKSYPIVREKMLADLENYWLEKEKCIEDTHDRDYGLNEETIIAMDEALKKGFEIKYPCDFGAEVMECYKHHQTEPLECRPEVLRYMECIDGVRQKVAVRLSLATRGIAAKCVPTIPEIKK